MFLEVAGLEILKQSN